MSNWKTEGLKTLPIGAGTVLADTGQLDAGNYSLLSLCMSASLAATFELQHRNAANNANIFSQRFYMSLVAPVVVDGTFYFTGVAQDERLRIVLIDALTLGNAQASFYLT
jgi:hypothetical protein